MSVYAEYLNAETEEERQEALIGMKWEARQDEYFERLAENKTEETEHE